MKKKQEQKSKIELTTSNIILFITLGLFAVSVLAEIFIPTYKTNVLFYSFLGLVAGAQLRKQ